MALLHHATLTPSKRDLMAAWLATRDWCPDPDVTVVASYRFDDPAGEVGIEAAVLRTPDGTLLHVPLTYRGAPLEGADAHLAGTMEHSVLGARWVYDACGDPVGMAALATAVLTGGSEAEQYFEEDGRREVREPSMTVRGSGSDEPSDASSPAADAVEPHDDGGVTTIRVDAREVLVARVLGTDLTAGGPVDGTLTGRWDGQEPVTLAAVRHLPTT
ncbi:hypothetical protein H5V45_13065 [Nocardioides sp. KIGAM211]|uniref:Maltokinase N-terminal cap domain-containing protein n=1 Tax=Nocardioides luti TaxID=2761101 RepID=A0A7X0RH97_9ACTN|nr:hypothetical protein [Nocardioides luti]MBB6628252.1 hypothetical protein [Nocardioides luti]